MGEARQKSPLHLREGARGWGSPHGFKNVSDLRDLNRKLIASQVARKNQPVILSEAKDLLLSNKKKQILRFAQDDKQVPTCEDDKPTNAPST